MGPVSRGQVTSRADPLHGDHFVASLEATVMISVDVSAVARQAVAIGTGLSPRTAAARLPGDVGQQTQAFSQDVKQRSPQRSTRDLLD